MASTIEEKTTYRWRSTSTVIKSRPMQKGTLRLRPRFRDLVWQSSINKNDNATWWWNFDRLLRNDDALQQPVVCIIRNPLRWSFLQFFIHQNRLLFGKVTSVSSVGFVSHVRKFFAKVGCTKTLITQRRNNICTNGFQLCNLEIMGYKKM